MAIERDDSLATETSGASPVIDPVVVEKFAVKINAVLQDPSLTYEEKVRRTSEIYHDPGFSELVATFTDPIDTDYQGKYPDFG